MHGGRSPAVVAAVLRPLSRTADPPLPPDRAHRGDARARTRRRQTGPVHARSALFDLYGDHLRDRAAARRRSPPWSGCSPRSGSPRRPCAPPCRGWSGRAGSTRCRCRPGRATALTAARQYHGSSEAGEPHLPRRRPELGRPLAPAGRRARADERQPASASAAGLAFLGYGQLADAHLGRAAAVAGGWTGCSRPTGVRAERVHRARTTATVTDGAWSAGPGTSTRWRRRTRAGWPTRARCVAGARHATGRPSRRSRPAASSCTSGASSCSPTRGSPASCCRRTGRVTAPRSSSRPRPSGCGPAADRFVDSCLSRLGLTPPRAWQPARWSSTIPVACISAYAVVGPTNAKPRALQLLGHRGRLRRGRRQVGRVVSRRRPRCGRARTTTAARTAPRAARPRPARCARAAAILARLRTMPASASSRASSAGAEGGHRGDREAGERRAERRPLAQDREPGQPRLERLEGQPLEQRVVALERPAPLGVVVGDVLGRAGAPRAARQPVRRRPRRRRPAHRGPPGELALAAGAARSAPRRATAGLTTGQPARPTAPSGRSSSSRQTNRDRPPRQREHLEDARAPRTRSPVCRTTHAVRRLPLGR